MLQIEKKINDNSRKELNAKEIQIEDLRKEALEKETDLRQEITDLK